jgi:hypothetical protein
MTEKSDRASADRRDFLKLAGVGAVAGGVALVSGGESAEASTAAVQGKGLYKQTNHVRTYYDLARF